VTLTADAARTLALTGGVPDSLGGALARIVGIVALFVPLSVWRDFLTAARRCQAAPKVELGHRADGAPVRRHRR
jgi:hypothetical protein